MKGLTPKQYDLLQFIQQFITKNHYSPSYREMMDHFSLASPGSIYKYIRTLKRKGMLTADKSSRSLQLTNALPLIFSKSEVELPLIGNISAGYPIEMFIKPQTLSIPISMVHHPENTYVFRIQGEGFHEELIQDGDLILIEARQEIQSGETILGLLNQHNTLIKKYFTDGQNIRLESHQHHQHFLTLESEHLDIKGAIVGLLRAY